MMMSEQTWFQYGSILWWAYLAMTAAVLLSCLGLWIYAVRAYPQSHAERDDDNLVDIRGPRLRGDGRDPAQKRTDPAADGADTESEALRTA